MSKKRSVTDKTIAHKLVYETIDEQVGNLTQRHSEKGGCYRDVAAVLISFAREAARLSMSGRLTPPDFSNWEWKENFAGEAIESMEKQGIKIMIDEMAIRMRTKFPRVISRHNNRKWAYYKIALHSGQVARMILFNLDPEYLRMSESEAYDSQMELLRYAKSKGVPAVSGNAETLTAVISEKFGRGCVN